MPGLIAVEGDPLADLDVLKNIPFIMKDGVTHQRLKYYSSHSNQFTRRISNFLIFDVWNAIFWFFFV